VDVDRFAAELPDLFDDFPRSETPRARRFDDVVEGIPSLATENVLAVLNLAASLLPPDESYVEVGSFFGASIIGAMRGNTGDFVAIDSFAFDVPELRGKPLPPASRAGLEESLARFDAESATILEGDAFETIEGGALGDRRVGVYYYDGPHDQDSTVRGLEVIEPWLADEALLVVDDHDLKPVVRATRKYVAGQPKASLLLEVGGRRNGQPQWWEGVGVLAWRA